MLMNWELVHTRWDAGLNMLTFEIMGVPCVDTDDLHELTLKDVEQLKVRAIKYLNTFVHTDLSSTELCPKEQEQL